MWEFGSWLSTCVCVCACVCVCVCVNTFQSKVFACRKNSGVIHNKHNAICTLPGCVEW